ncbi:MAG: Gfo/Idh/MocA family protein [Pirellulales bacterium]
MNRVLNWGILGTGNITRQFAEGVVECRRGRVAAVGSRSPERARAFADQHNVPAAHGDYQALLADRDVEVVYNALPNSLHHEWTIKALRAGKHVLCEKPFASNLAESEEMFDVAGKAGLVLVEAFMYRSHPLTQAVLDVVRRGEIGELKVIRSSFCFRIRSVENNVRFRADLAGGALMDVGCYCIDFSRLFAGAEPASIAAVGHLTAGGVDDVAAGSMRFPNGLVAEFCCGISVQADNTAFLCGSEGFVEIPVPWKPPAENAVFHVRRAKPAKSENLPPQAVPPYDQTFVVNARMNLYGLEIDDFAAAVLDGAPPRLTRNDTLGNMRVLDDLRRQLGVTLPGS